MPRKKNIKKNIKNLSTGLWLVEKVCVRMGENAEVGCLGRPGIYVLLPL